jgi:hypothetical protein
MGPLRSLSMSVAVGLVNALLRRRIAPTVEISAERA